MTVLNKYNKYIPYLYYVAVIAYWFTHVNRANGIIAYPILLFGLPFLWQIVRPNRKLNAILGITFVCLSSYLILAYLFNILNIIPVTNLPNQYVIYIGLFVIINFIMAVWIIRNTIKKSF
ncbi:membrane protein [Mangrovimonas yunxiaonensis]|uniref:Membrane protein n=1 Tax=Mangrovimonas yunxiaonensis TaxID=1197477 RepID=A0A084TNU7_9FLAO|nr:hypothetical protein [Mangrovimonas yunxiaonensis]KFB02383.1 membrane protein [Mangrovimonas yunxiaonensis]GGH40012.1 hypothetical protein GCM10011364_09810 [Mangrovimonas yunxiaonensis]